MRKKVRLLFIKNIHTMRYIVGISSVIFIWDVC